MPLISFVIPCYNEAESIPLFVDELSRVVCEMRAAHPELTFEAVFVDDGSTDDTMRLIRAAAAGTEITSGEGGKLPGTLDAAQLAKQPAMQSDAPAAEQVGMPAAEQLAASADVPFNVRWVSFSRNFGKESALYAGLSAAKGDFVATLDADMQDPPSLLPRMYDELIEGNWDNVATRRYTREGEPVIRSFFARRFYKLINRLSDTEIVDGARDFRLMRRRMVDAILSVTEYNRFSKGIFSWVGFSTKWIEYENTERVAGESKWSFWSLMKYAIEGIVGYSTAPLSAVAVIGGLFSLLAIVFLIIVLVRAALFGDPVAGWPSTMSVILFIGGLQMLFLGVIGQYLAKTYLETKRRPLYVIRESSDD